jgi:glycosyltransferase involved in cell wall biosynthesis
MQKKLKIYTAASARGLSTQIARIEQGFVDLGHEITQYPGEADLVFQNNAPFDQVINDRLDLVFKSEAKFIFNILDLAPHCPDFPLQKIREQVKYADAVTVISEYVKNDCFKRLSHRIHYHVIYNPQMPVAYNPNLKKHPYKYLAVGRTGDGNKRVGMALEALYYMGVREDEIGIIGNEYPGYGTILGNVTNEYLNELYNSADYVLMPSKNEGIGLTALEAASCRVIPIITPDLTTREEFFPAEVFPEYKECSPNVMGLIYLLRHFEDNPSKKEEFKDRVYEYYKNELEDKFKGVEVAKKIINIYSNLI